MLAFKVVDSNDRSLVLSYVNPFSVRYKIGKEVVAPKKTWGLFCFLEEEQAINFSSRFPTMGCRSVLLVRNTGRVRYPDSISYNPSGLASFYHWIRVCRKYKDIPYALIPSTEIEAVLMIQPPTGTVCFSKLIVLDRIYVAKGFCG